MQQYKLRLMLSVVLLAACPVCASAAEERWSAEQAQTWSESMPWLVGCNYAPRSAINQMEMWQAETFDPQTIDEELGWARGLGFNSIRVFLHHLLWEQDSEGFCQRIDRFLAIAERHQIGVMFVLFDGVWDPHPKLGRQRDPKPHVHNSGWVQSPGVAIIKSPDRHAELKNYVVGVVSRYRDDARVQIWDLFNEPDNRNLTSYGKAEPVNKAELVLKLLEKCFAWARSAKPTQPLTVGIWHGDWSSDEKMTAIDRYMVEQSDVLSFHSYDSIAGARRKVEMLNRFGRPLLCTEYMARPAGSRFDPHLKYFKDNRVGAYNWGFVAGKSQTIYPWDSWWKTYTAEPPVWFHDIFRPDGTPYDKLEVQFIREQTGAP